MIDERKGEAGGGVSGRQKNDRDGCRHKQTQEEELKVTRGKPHMLLLLNEWKNISSKRGFTRKHLSGRIRGAD